MESEGKKLSIDTVLIHISSPSGKNIGFQEKYGFKEYGGVIRIGRKFEKDFDNVWRHKIL